MSVAAAALLLAPASARADALGQDNEVMFGVVAAYVPGQNDLQGDVAAIGHYVSYSHAIDAVYIGLRLALLYGWLPSGATGQQYIVEPDAFIGVRLKLGKPLALRLELGTGPLLNGGEGFSTASVDHTYLRAAVQWNILKSVRLEAFAGPSFAIGSYVAAVFPELGLGAGWDF